MTLNQRYNVAIKERLCFRCCNSNTHRARDCRSAKPCSIRGCGRTHHPLLHSEGRKARTETSTEPQDNELNCHLHKSNDILYQIVPVTLKNGDKEIRTYAFLDSGSSVSLIQEDLIRTLDVVGHERPMTLAWTNGKTMKETQSQEVKIKIKGEKGKSYTLNGLRTVNKLSLPSQTINKKHLLKRYPYLKDTDICAYNEAQPKIIIGQPHAFLMCGSEERSGRFNQPIAKLTKLGWALHGMINHSKDTRNIERLFMIDNKENVENHEYAMRQHMTNYFTTEGFGVKVLQEQLISKKEERAVQLMKETTKSESRKFKPYVQHRIGEILETTTENQWRFVDTKNNPADEGTKTTLKNSIWNSGPSFLKETESNWPSLKTFGTTIEDIRPICLIQSEDVPKNDIGIKWCSDWTRLKRAICSAKNLRNIFIAKKNGIPYNHIITAKEMREAEKILIRQAQKDIYPEEVFNLSQGLPIEKESSIRNLTPFLDPDGLLRSDTRFRNANCSPYRTRCPYILPKNHHSVVNSETFSRTPQTSEG